MYPSRFTIRFSTADKIKKNLYNMENFILLKNREKKVAIVANLI